MNKDIINVIHAYDLIRDSKGKIFTAEFYKKNGDLRKIKARLGVSKGVKGVGLKYNPKAFGYLSVFDMELGDYRTLNLNTLKTLNINGEKFRVVNY